MRIFIAIVITVLLYVLALFNVGWAVSGPMSSAEPNVVLGVIFLLMSGLSLVLPLVSFFFKNRQWRILAFAVLLGVLATAGILSL